MSITKHFLKKRATCKVKFHLSPEEANGATKVFLVGNFNDWSRVSHPMKKKKDGSFSLEIDLPLGQDFQFRYYLDNDVWINDVEADAYMICSYSNAENFLVKV